MYLKYRSYSTFNNYDGSYVKNITDDSVLSPLVIFKLPRSGSTWFTEIMNRVPNCFIMKELIQSGDVGKHSYPVVINHLIRALKEPSDKLSFHVRNVGSDRKSYENRSSVDKVMNLVKQITASGNNIIRGSDVHFTEIVTGKSGRYFEDYFHRMKFIHKNLVVGFSLNLEHVEDVDWNDVIPKVDAPLNILAYHRSNVVKAAVSGYTGRLVKQHCGHSNLKSGGVFSKAIKTDICSGKAVMSIPWTPTEFCHQINRWQTRLQTFLNRVSAIYHRAPRNSLRLLYLSYEELQLNGTKVLKSIYGNKFLNYTAASLPHQYIDSVLSFDGMDAQDYSNTIKSNWVKRTGEDLSNVLVHYRDIALKLTPSSSGSGSCNRFLKQLESTNPVYDEISLHTSLTKIDNCDADIWSCS